MSKMTLKNVASFGENRVTLETDKKINLIYGLNGTGKTTLSDFLYFQQKESKFKNCTLEGMDDKKILVYNQNFIRDNFYNQDELKGIFTLSKENKEAEEAIKKSEEKKQKKELEKSKKQDTKQQHEEEKTRKVKEIKEVIWKIKTKYTGGDRVLDFCLSGLQKKDLLFNYIKDVQKNFTQPSTTIDELRNEAHSISGENAQKNDELKKISFNIKHIEQDPTFSEVIVGNEDSPVSNLIKTLNNSDWVQQGLDYLSDENAEKCPFCQEKTITEKVAKNIRAYFDETYEQKIAEIKQLQEQYQQISLPAVEGYLDHPLVEKSKDEFENSYNKIKRYLDKNLSRIESKLKEPSQKITLDNTEDELNTLNTLIVEINKKIQEHNQKIDNKKSTKTEIKNKFWQIMRWEYDSQLNAYDAEIKKINQIIEKLKNDIDEINKNIQSQIQEIQNQQKTMVNIEEAIRHINNGLHGLGIEGFSLLKHQENSYRIAREGQSKNQFSTLSEGEKMIISFLYFMELCKGKESEEEPNKDKIVVIDDPISSLSHIYIFNVSEWIKKHFFTENYTEVFVLTHSLYFFHELMKCKGSKKFFRITKSSSTGTQIQTMKGNEINNEYESYWQVIKDHDEGKAPNALLATSMRNILEHFLGFIGKETLSEALNELVDDGEFTPFYRYMNRESHSDPINITDNKEIDPELFKGYFERVFTAFGNEKHYKKMMGKES